MGLGANGDERFALAGRARPLVARPEVVKNRVVDDLAAVHARKADAPTGGRKDNVVCDREIRPIAVERVDALEEVRERQIWIGLPDDPIAIDHNVAELAGIALHAVRVGAVGEVDAIMNVILCDQDVVRRVVYPIVAEALDLVSTPPAAEIPTMRLRARHSAWVQPEVSSDDETLMFVKTRFEPGRAGLELTITMGNRACAGEVSAVPSTLIPENTR